LTRLRGELLSAHLRDLPDEPGLDESWIEFSATLAMQCFANDYVYSVSAAESEQVQQLTTRLNHGPDNWPALAMLSAYRATYRLAAAADIAKIHARAPPWIMPLLQRALLEPLSEWQLRAAIADGAPGDPTSRSVQAQYEESPYPRWQNLEQQIPLTVAAFLREEIAHFVPPAIFEQPANILIAGCGTGEHALRVAARHPQCQVYAIDLSRASLAYATRKAHELNIGNIDFQHRDILELRRDERRYALIESVGVIHHMRDPAAGLAALCARLIPGGIIKLGLYSRKARVQVNAARARIRELALPANDSGMRSLRERILSGQEPQLRSLCESQDFYTLSTVRDLLFHVQEHQYDTAELHALLSAHDLHVIGFQVTARTRRQYLQRFADDPALANLEHWGQFEEQSPGTFAGMYQFWCRR
jgi:SAM-dependent methyltransferase